MLNRNFVQTDDSMKDSKETATTFNVSQTSASFRRIATVAQLQLEQTHRQTHTYTHTQSA